MESEIIHYLILISKLKDIIKYIDNNFQENDIKSYILECKKLCLENLKKQELIKMLTEELTDDIKQDTDKDTDKEDTDKEDTDKEDTDLSNQISSLTGLLGGEQEISINNFDPSTFDSIGSGLARILQIGPQISPQIQTQNTSINLIKNEIKNTNNKNNLSYQIKKKTSLDSV